MKKSAKTGLTKVLLSVIKKYRMLTAGILIAVVGAVVTALLPPLVLEKAVNLLTGRKIVPFRLALLYFLLISLSSILEALRESLLIIFGQKITHGLRSVLCAKLSAFRRKLL